ncbi:DUF5723 family protein [Pedobacter frigoris]|uniref:DUF5723 domain-containing protein n=1 Tax=Pedobacter frigoris TaxID=2571272 RepID=A0A4U1CTG1_9SPHI|nr:DUF5723 family protein [Pedobacter frigoris]TKC09028.1 hypothetical protein FA047_02735 [Pedobacter frigoris]
MNRRYLVICIVFFTIQSKAQQYGLFNTKTLFDGFENPAQKTFVLDSSRKFASNFFLPYLGFNASSKGNESTIRRLINEGVYSAKDITIGNNEVNHIFESSNIYLFNFKIFKSYKFHKEIGLSWQLRTDGNVDYTNETFALLDNYNRFDAYKGQDFDDAFNNNGYAQSYHQFSVSYRENYNKRLAFGVKLSLLSGITYNKLQIDESFFNPGSDTQPLVAALKGTYRANFLETDELSKKDLVPTFKNPGLAISLGTSYTSKTGVFLMANVKDLGIIRWTKNSYYNRFNNINDPLIIMDPETSPSSIESRITEIATDGETRERFYSVTNAKADFMISKAFSISVPYFTYTPALIVSKNLFYKGGDAAFVNKFKYDQFSLTAIPSYNFNNLFLFGMQGMYQTPNFEVFLGSDDLFKTVSQAKGAIKQDITIGKGYNGASFYLGVGIKFGNTVEHPQNSSTMPGINDGESSFFKRLFSVFSKKR